jgi:chitinase
VHSLRNMIRQSTVTMRTPSLRSTRRTRFFGRITTEAFAVGRPSKKSMYNGILNVGINRIYATAITRVTAVGNGIRATGTWTCDYSYGVNDSHRDYGDVWWVLVREGDTWKIRKDTQTGTPWPTQ